MARQPHIFGVDFGTTNSCIAVLNENKLETLKYPQPLLFPEGVDVITDESSLSMSIDQIPSCVHFFTDPSSLTTKALAGQEARHALSKFPFSTVHSIKRLLGKKYNSPEIQPYLDPEKSLDFKFFLGYNVDVKTVDGICVYGTSPDFRKKTWEIVQMIFDRIRGVIYENYREENPYILVGIPGKAKNDQEFKLDLARGIREARCRLVGFLAEPEATAYAYSRYIDSKNRILGVLDVGGGTTDFSIIYFSEKYGPLAARTDGCHDLGGDDFDYELVKNAVDKYKRKTREGFKLIWEDPNVRYRYKDSAEQCKKNLSYEQKIELKVPGILPKIDPCAEIKEVYSKKDLEEITKPLVDRIVELAVKVTEDSQGELKRMLGNSKPALLDGIIFSGGQCRMPYIRKRVSEALASRKMVSQDLALFDSSIKGDYPDQSIALGLALYGAELGDPTRLKIPMAGDYLIPPRRN